MITRQSLSLSGIYCICVSVALHSTEHREPLEFLKQPSHATSQPPYSLLYDVIEREQSTTQSSQTEKLIARLIAEQGSSLVHDGHSLHQAITQQDDTIVGMLLAHGADPYQKSTHYAPRSPYFITAQAQVCWNKQSALTLCTAYTKFYATEKKFLKHGAELRCIYALITARAHRTLFFEPHDVSLINQPVINNYLPKEFMLSHKNSSHSRIMIKYLHSLLPEHRDTLRTICNTPDSKHAFVPPLWYAILYARPDVVRELLAAGADPAQPCMFGVTPHILYQLLEKSADDYCMHYRSSWQARRHAIGELLKATPPVKPCKEYYAMMPYRALLQN